MIRFTVQRLPILSTLLILSFPLPVLAQTKHSAEEAGIKSTPGNPATSTFINFVNKSQEQIKVYWLDRQGKRVLYLTLNPGQNGKVKTYLTHPWLVTDSQDNAKDIFFPDSLERTVEIHAKTLSAEGVIEQIFRSETPLPGATTEEHQNLMKLKASVLAWLGSYRGVRSEKGRSVILFERGSVPVKVHFKDNGEPEEISAEECPVTSVPMAQAPSQFRQALSECPDLKP
jgi:von Hippel-Lindau disease tumor supressor